MKCEKELLKQVEWAGLDWADSNHVVVATDACGRRIHTLVVQNTSAGLQELADSLRAMPSLRGIAVEATRALVIHRLLQEGFQIYPINPKMSAAWRNAWTVAGVKSDERDALALAAGLAIQHETCKPLSPETGLARELAILCEDEMHFIAEKAGLVNKLKATLKQYYPAALAWFQDWTRPVAWEFLSKFPNGQDLAHANTKDVYAFVKVHRLRLTPQRRASLENLAHAATNQADEATVRALTMRVITVVEQLKILRRKLNEYRKRIEILFAQHPDTALYASLPGAGEKLAPRLAVVFGTQRKRFDAASAIQQLSGLAPITCSSGKQVLVKYRWAFNSFYRNTLYQFAFCSKRECVWANEFYSYRRGRGDSHAQALRNLGYKWVKIIFRMWQTQMPYDDQCYINAMKKRGGVLPCCTQ